jgi:predicted ArsR family transcriptional regulator
MYVLGQEEMKKPRGRPPNLFKLMDERRKKREEARKEVTCETKNN